MLNLLTIPVGVVPPVQALPALLPAQPGPVPRQVPLRPGGRRQAGLEADQGAPHQHQGIREALGCHVARMCISRISLQLRCSSGIGDTLQEY